MILKKCGKMKSNIYKKIIFYIILIALFSVILFIIGEFGLRLLGFTPDNPDRKDLIKVTPGGKYFMADDYLGYTHIAGKFRIFLPHNYSFITTHDSATLRITHPEEMNNSYANKEKIWIFGCSCTHGWSINDWETYPWRLQEKCREYEIINYGVSGYGTIHSLLLLQRDLKKKIKPRIVILAYASMHDARNTLSASRRKAATAYNFLGTIVQPYAELANARLIIHKPCNVTYHRPPFNTKSALIHFIERAFNALQARFSDSHTVTKAIIEEMNRLCIQNHITFIVAGINNDKRTTEMLSYCNNMKILTVDISIDNKSGKYTNEPYDPHPNALANHIYADKIFKFLTTHRLLFQ